VHHLRDRLDAVLVGAGTVRADNPRLTCRLPGPSHRDPLRVVLSGRLDFSPDARVVTHAGSPGRPTAIVATARRADRRRVARLQSAGAQVVRLPGRRGRLDLEALLQALGRLDIATLLIEGGAEVAASFLEAGLVDQVIWFVAPKIVGGRDAVPAVGGQGATRMDQALQLEELAVKRVGDDLMLTGLPMSPGGSPAALGRARK
jgi:diaminohydroxyphosphoribosylaminopyrimidine deaminase/5-amino-6-(5-phosphoribosylamino)uracil reductase